MTHKTISIGGALISATMLLCAVLPACTHSHESHEDHEEDTEKKEDSHGDEILLSHEALESAGIQLETVTPTEFRNVIKTSGVIENSRGSERIIAAPATGVVSFSNKIVAGAAVRSGEALFSISSKGLEQSDATSSLHIDESLAEKELRRAEALLRDSLISKKEYERLKSEYERSRAASSGIASRSRTGITVASPMAGFLINVNVTPGSFVNMGDPLATVAADRRLMLRADVSERDRHEISSVTGANIRVSGSDEVTAIDGKGFRILSTNPTVNTGSHYLPVYMEFDNPGGLGSGSVAEIWLLGTPREGVISVPRSAIVEDGGLFFVFVEKHHGAFEKTEVSTGATDGMRVEITKGLHGGEKVAVEGALRIKMAGMGSSIPGHSHHH